jgi:hypothetical protein
MWPMADSRPSAVGTAGFADARCSPLRNVRALTRAPHNRTSRTSGFTSPIREKKDRSPDLGIVASFGWRRGRSKGPPSFGSVAPTSSERPEQQLPSSADGAQKDIHHYEDDRDRGRDRHVNWPPQISR